MIDSISCRVSLTTAKLPVVVVPEPETIKPVPVIRSPFLPLILDNKENKELSTALRRRRDRFTRQATHIQQQELLNNSSNTLYNGVYGNTNGVATNGGYTNGTYVSKPYSNITSVMNGVSNYTVGINGMNGINGINGTNNGGNVVNGVIGLNGLNALQNEEELEKLNRPGKTLIIPDALKNGLFVL